MARADDDDRLILGENYDLERYSFGDSDEQGHLIWHRGYPSNADWDRIRIVTIDYEIDGEGHYRNIPISPDRPLDPYGSNHPDYQGPHRGGRYGPDYYYDLDDLATNFYWSTDTP